SFAVIIVVVPVLAAPPGIPVAGGGDAPAQEIGEQIADQLVLAEARPAVVEPGLLELELDVLELPPARRQRLQPRLLLFALGKLFLRAAAGIVDLLDDGIVLPGAGGPRLFQQLLDILPPEPFRERLDGGGEGRIAALRQFPALARRRVAGVLEGHQFVVDSRLPRLGPLPRRSPSCATSRRCRAVSSRPPLGAPSSSPIALPRPPPPCGAGPRGAPPVASTAACCSRSSSACAASAFSCWRSAWSRSRSGISLSI